VHNTGVIILALGNPYYGECAANLAMSLKATDSSLPIHLVYHGKALNHIQDRLHFFDTKQEAPQETYMKRGFTRYFKVKTFIYDLSPFENTVYLDVDMIWLNRPLMELVLNELQDVAFTIQNRGRFDLKNGQKVKYFWAKYEDVRKQYENYSNSFLYNLHSEFIWFKKSEENKKYFDRVKEIYDNPPIHPEIFAGDVADELCYGLATIELNKHPHKVPFVPVYWQQLDKDAVQIPDIQKKYYGFSAGGNSHPKIAEEKYNILARAYASKYGLSPHLLKKKRSILPERAKM